MRTIVSRLLLAALAVASVFAIGRALGGASHPADVVHLEGLDAEALAHRGFTVRDGGARVVVHVVGSYEGVPGAALAGAGAAPLAAYGWLVRREADGTGRLQWRPAPRRRASSGALFALRDTLELAPGRYDAYFAAYGDPLVRSADAPSEALADRLRAALSRGGRAWLGESDRWRFVVSGVTDADRAALHAHDDDDAPAATSVWTSGSVGSRDTEETLLIVDREARVRLRATTEVAGRVVADSAWLQRVDAPAGTPALVWAADAASGRWAGGSLKNRAYDTTLVLAPGLYRARFAADRSHAAGDWAANPPYDPTAWGLRVDADAGVAVFDPADPSGLPEIARVDCAGPGRDDRVAFTLTAPTTVIVAAAGEISSESSMYDYGALERGADAPRGGPNRAGALPWDGTPVWTMSYDRSTHAGGADRNRRETATLQLAPGRYALRYVTDGSHDCQDDWGGDGPDDPFWGVVLRAASPSFDAGSVQGAGPLTADGDDAGPDGAEARADGAVRRLDELDVAPEGRVLARLNGLGPDSDVRARLRLDAPAGVRVVALGELLPSERLDWGWIENADGDVVWEMSRANTVPAGGAPKNRRFDGLVELPAGTYTVRFRTNERHDASGFDDGRPRNPSSWGIRVEEASAPADE